MPPLLCMGCWATLVCLQECNHGEGLNGRTEQDLWCGPVLRMDCALAQHLHCAAVAWSYAPALGWGNSTVAKYFCTFCRRRRQTAHFASFQVVCLAFEPFLPLEALVKPPAFCGLLSTACCCLRPAGEAEGIRLQAAATSEALHHISEALRVNPLSPQVRLPSHDFFPLYGPQTVVVVSPFLPRLHLLCNGKVMQVTTL